MFRIISLLHCLHVPLQTKKVPVSLVLVLSFNLCLKYLEVRVGYLQYYLTESEKNKRLTCTHYDENTVRYHRYNVLKVFLAISREE